MLCVCEHRELGMSFRLCEELGCHCQLSKEPRPCWDINSSWPRVFSCHARWPVGALCSCLVPRQGGRIRPFGRGKQRCILCGVNISKVTCSEICAGFLLVHPLCVLRHSAALTMLLSKDFATSPPHTVQWGWGRDCSLPQGGTVGTGVSLLHLGTSAWVRGTLP